MLPSGAVSSAVEHRSYTPRATGSNPVPPTTKVTILPLLIDFVSFVQDLMYEGDRNRSLTDRGRDAFEASFANVADGEYAGQTCFKQMGNPGERPVGSGEVF